MHSWQYPRICKYCHFVHPWKEPSQSGLQFKKLSTVPSNTNLEFQLFWQDTELGTVQTKQGLSHTTACSSHWNWFQGFHTAVKLSPIMVQVLPDSYKLTSFRFHRKCCYDLVEVSRWDIFYCLFSLSHIRSTAILTKTWAFPSSVNRCISVQSVC